MIIKKKLNRKKKGRRLFLSVTNGDHQFYIFAREIKKSEL